MKYTMFNKWTSLIIALVITAGCIAAGLICLNDGRTVLGVLFFCMLLIPVIFIYEMYNNIVFVGEDEVVFYKLNKIRIPKADIERVQFASLAKGTAVFIISTQDRDIRVKAGISASALKCAEIEKVLNGLSAPQNES